jgi:hypothetical protein
LTEKRVIKVKLLKYFKKTNTNHEIDYSPRRKQVFTSLLGGAVTLLAVIISPQSAMAGTNIDWNELKNGRGPVVFLVNGFGGCAPCISRPLHDKLKANGIAVYDLDWNDINRRTQASNLNLNDAEFLKQMEEVLNTIPESRPIVLIGHSFGGDSSLKVARRTSKRIALLGVLDAVEKGGVRTTQSVGNNVDYFFNRWTSNSTSAIPLNSGKSGELNCSAGNCDQKNQSYGYRADGSAIKDSCGSSEITCPGYNPIPVALGGSNGTKHRRITHGGDNAIYKDQLIQEQLFQKIQQISVASRSNPSKTVQNTFCVSVDSKRGGWQRFNLNSSFTKVASISGGWSVDTRNYSPVGAVGHTGRDADLLKPYEQYKFDQRFPFGALLMNSGNGILYIQDSNSLSSAPFGAVDMRINDADNALGDNGGSLNVCFGN